MFEFCAVQMPEAGIQQPDPISLSAIEYVLI